MGARERKGERRNEKEKRDLLFVGAREGEGERSSAGHSCYTCQHFCLHSLSLHQVQARHAPPPFLPHDVGDKTTTVNFSWSEISV